MCSRAHHARIYGLALTTLGAAFAVGGVVAQVLFRRSVIYPK